MRLLPSILLVALAFHHGVKAAAGPTQVIASSRSELRTSNDPDFGPAVDERRLAEGPATSNNATEATGNPDPTPPEQPVGNGTSTADSPTNDPGSPTTDTAPSPPQAEDPSGGAKDPPTTNDLVPGGDATPPGPSTGNATTGGPQPGGEASLSPPNDGDDPPPPPAGEHTSTATSSEGQSTPKAPKGTTGPPSSKSKKGASKKGDSATDPEAATAEGNGSNCASLQASSVKGQVQYTVEVIAATEKDAAVVADDVNDLVVSSLTKSLVKNECKRRRLGTIQDQRRRLYQHHRRRMAENQFLSISSGGSKASGPCPSGDARCFRVVSTVNFDVVEGDGSGTADKQVIEALKPAFATLSSNQVQFIDASSGEQDQTSVAAAEGSSSQESRTGPGISPATIGIVLGVLVASVLAVALYVLSQRRRARRFNAELDKVEKELNVTDVTADDSNLVYVYDDESEGYESDYQLSPRERRFLSKLRLPRRKKKSKSTASVPPQIDTTFVDEDDQSVEVIERTTLKVPPVPRTYSGTIITPPPEPKRTRRERFANTVDF